jgi:hypothetical protein
MRLNLPGLTLVMIDVQCHDLARLVIADCMRDIDCADAVGNICPRRQKKRADSGRSKKAPTPKSLFCRHLRCGLGFASPFSRGAS